VARIEGVDEELLAEAARAFGTTTDGDTVTEALHRIVEMAHERRRALEPFSQLADSGELGSARLDQLDE